MKYQISQKILALGGDYTVRDERGNEAFYFDGKVFNFGGKKVAVLDSKGKEVARMSRKLLSLRTAYRIIRNRRVAAIVRRRPFTVRDQFVIDLPGSGDYHVVGDYIGHEYSIKKSGKDIARVSKKFFGASDSYGVDIASGDTLLILCAVVVIDMVLFKNLKTTSV